MDKRALSAIPRPVLTDRNKEMLLLVPHISYLATASRQEVNGIDTLIINFFHAEPSIILLDIFTGTVMEGISQLPRLRKGKLFSDSYMNLRKGMIPKIMTGAWNRADP